ncbi:MAG: glycosyltransferase [Candidatus Heimdallarchaeaceae archaeon]
MKIKSTISVVIPARDSRDTIRTTLQSLLSQTVVPLEIILVVTKGDNTQESIQDLIVKKLVTVVETEPPDEYIRDAHWKRWVGAKIAQGNIIFFTDSKVIVQKNALEETEKMMRKYGVEALAGATSDWPTEKKTFLSRFQDSALIRNNPDFPEVKILTKQNFGKTEHLPVTTGLALTQKAFRTIEKDFGLNFSKVASTYDDYVISWLLVESSINILLTNRVLVHHKHRSTWKDYIKQLSRSGQSAAIMLSFYPNCTFARRRQLQVFAISACIFVAIVTAIVTLVFVPKTALLIGSYLTLTVLVLLGILNVIKAKSLWGFLMPAVSIFMILVFSKHYIRYYVKNGKFNQEEFDDYLQIN